MDGAEGEGQWPSTNSKPHEALPKKPKTPPATPKTLKGQLKLWYNMATSETPRRCLSRTYQVPHRNQTEGAHNVYQRRALNLRLAPCERQALDAVAHYEGRTPTSMLRELIREAARERGLWAWIIRRRQLDANPGDAVQDDPGPQAALANGHGPSTDNWSHRNPLAGLGKEPA